MNNFHCPAQTEALIVDIIEQMKRSFPPEKWIVLSSRIRQDVAANAALYASRLHTPTAQPSASRPEATGPTPTAPVAAPPVMAPVAPAAPTAPVAAAAAVAPDAPAATAVPTVPAPTAPVAAPVTLVTSTRFTELMNDMRSNLAEFKSRLAPMLQTQAAPAVPTMSAPTAAVAAAAVMAPVAPAATAVPTMPISSTTAQSVAAGHQQKSPLPQLAEQQPRLPSTPGPPRPCTGASQVLQGPPQVLPQEPPRFVQVLPSAAYQEVLSAISPAAPTPVTTTTPSTCSSTPPATTTRSTTTARQQQPPPAQGEHRQPERRHHTAARFPRCRPLQHATCLCNSACFQPEPVRSAERPNGSNPGRRGPTRRDQGRPTPATTACPARRVCPEATTSGRCSLGHQGSSDVRRNRSATAPSASNASIDDSDNYIAAVQALKPHLRSCPDSSKCVDSPLEQPGIGIYVRYDYSTIDVPFDVSCYYSTIYGPPYVYCDYGTST